VRSGARISVLSDNGIEALVVFCGALRAGVIVNPINVEIREKHVSQILHDVAPQVIFWSRELPNDPRALGTGGASWIPFGGWAAPRPAPDDLFARLGLVSDAPVATRPARTDWSLIDYTSGTTDAPKGAIWTHEAYYAMCESPVDRLEISEADTILDYRHFSWSSPQILSIGPALLTGATLVLARKFSQARFFDWLRDYRVTVCVGIPTVINMLLARPVAVTKADLPALRFMTSSTAPLSVDKHLEFEKTYGIQIVQLAGGTETGFMCGNHPGHRKVGSIGRPTLNMRVRILDDAGRELPPGEEGEMVVSGRQLASAYWQGPDKLVPIPQDGFRNGDLARRDDEGYVYITGRKKDIIIKGGVNIASLEITNCLLEHPDVADAGTLACATTSTARSRSDSSRRVQGETPLRRRSSSTAAPSSWLSRCPRPSSSWTLFRRTPTARSTATRSPRSGSERTDTGPSPRFRGGDDGDNRGPRACPTAGADRGELASADRVLPRLDVRRLRDLRADPRGRRRASPAPCP